MKVLFLMLLLSGCATWRLMMNGLVQDVRIARSLIP